MKSKQPIPTGQAPKSTVHTKSIGELSNRLSDIELKLDHIIERIKDSLHSMNENERSEWEEKP
jgi:hypothetical protein